MAKQPTQVENMKQFEPYKNSYKKENNFLEVLNIGVYFIKSHMWGNGL